MAIFVCSDHHFGDEKLVQKGRKQFKDATQMAETIVLNHNKIVKKTDTCYFLGDLGFKESIDKYLPQMNGNKIFIYGNHDGYSIDYYLQYFTSVYKKPLFYITRILFSHEPQRVTPGVINIHGHTHLINLALSGYYNVSLDNTDFKPVSLKVYLKELNKFNKPNFKFLEEWYADYQITPQERPDLVVENGGLINAKKSLEKMRR